ncbi:disulfide bond formation protein DsbA [Picosynechococcus sp. PCC 7003]|uniref:DsbA family protein n=1 Tax=Picosynechococcus sp. PCC 7003 TaxID=374981 RepID=UPI000810CC71|nr:thioredoxin domain-containing protein [Picosynechococcus sp. PCC 7003]ANV83073.1 disulfide bond formation protein DsbA [Picosynechococcus sp. PCC 7003]
MILSLSVRQGFSRKMLALFSALCLGLSLWGCNGDQETAQADVNVDPELEAQILQVIRDNPQVLIDAVQNYQLSQQQAQQEEQQKAAEDFKQQVLTEPQTVIGDAPTLGAEDLKVVLIEFSDFECPFCARAHDTLKTFMAQNSDTVTLAYKHLPLAQIHPQAIAAAEASWAAQQQGKFWEYHDQLFENQDRLGEELYQEIAENLGLDMAKFEGDRQNAQPAIQKDLELAQQLGLNGTPFFVLASTETGKFETFSGALDLQQYEEKLAAITTP